jgi:hypothetical protein
MRRQKSLGVLLAMGAMSCHTVELSPQLEIVMPSRVRHPSQYREQNQLKNKSKRRRSRYEARGW